MPHEKGQGAASSFDKIINYSRLGAVECATSTLKRVINQLRGLKGSAVGTHNLHISIALSVLLVLAGYYAGSIVGIQLGLRPSGIGATWPPTAILLAALLLAPPRYWWMYLLGVIPAHLHVVASFQVPEVPLVVMLCQVGSNILLAVLAAFALRSLIGAPPQLGNRRNMGAFILLAVLATVIACAVAAWLFLLTGWGADFWLVWRQRVLANVFSIITIPPVIVLAFAGQLVGANATWRSYLELASITAGVLVVGIPVFGLESPVPSNLPALLLAPLPFLIWGAVRVGVGGTGLTLLIVAAIALANAYVGRGPFANQAPGVNVFSLQIFLTAISIPILLLAAFVEERQQEAESLKQAREQAELALAERNLQLALAGKVALVGSYGYDADKDTIQVDAGYAALHGLPEGTAETTRSEWRARTHPDDFARVKEMREQASGKGQREYAVEYRIVRSGGEVRWIESRRLITYTSEGAPQRVTGVDIDITERKRAELSLADRNKQLELAGKAARVGSFAIDVGTGMVQISPGYASVHGLAEGTEGFPREEWRARVHPDDLGRMDALRSEAIAEQRHEHNTEYRIVGPDGKARWIESRALYSYDSGRHPTRIVGVNIDMTERKRAQAALEESEARYRALYDDNPSMYFTVDASGTVLSVNEFGARQLGYTPAELVGQSVFKVIHNEDHEVARRHLASCTETNQKVVTTELRKVSRDGKIIWVREVARAVREPRQQRTVLVIVCEEITERKRAEEKLQKTERKLRELLEALPAAIYETDVAGHITYCNQSAVDLWGVAPTLGRDRWSDLAKFLHADGTPMALADCPTEIALKQGRIVRDREAIIERKDGRRIPIAPYPTPLRDEAGTMVGIVNMTVDISERKRTELALAERDAQLALAGKAARVGSFAVDYATERIQTSPGYAAIHGLAEGTEEYPRAEWRASVHPDDLPRVEALRRQAFAERGSEHLMEYRIVREDGETRWIESRGLVSYNDDGRPTRLIGVHIDITERKLAELSRADRNKQLELAGKAALVGRFAIDVDATREDFASNRMQVSPGFSAIYGLPEETAEISVGDWRSHVHPDDLPQFLELRQKVFAQLLREHHAEFRIVRPCGTIRWIETRSYIEYDQANRAKRMVGVNIDVTERKRAEEARTILNAELDHRVKNALATVSAVVSHTREGNRSVNDFIAALEGRLRSMATAHELLSAHRWQGISLTELIRRELDPYSTRNNTEIDGPGILLKPEAGQALAMVLHELATNAAKHGALSTKKGRVSIRWDRHLNGQPRSGLVLEWQEIGGPPIVAARASSYGTNTIRDLIPYELGGTVDLVLAPEGARCRLELPAAWLS
jgi:PAS domain S-box-containing protein